MLAVDQVHRMDALAGLRKLESESVALVCCDPPYNIASRNKTTIQQGKVVSTMQAWGAWDCYHPFDYDVLIMGLIAESYRVLQPGGALVVFTSRENNGHYVRQAVTRGFLYRNQIIIVKTTPLPSLGKSNWRSAFEVCMYLTKGPPKTFNFLSQKECVNVYYHPSRVRATTHPTEKPLGLIERIVRACSNEGDLVVDPFMGSGTTAVACVNSGRQFVGFDLEPTYVRMARDRVRAARQALTAQGAGTAGA